MNLYLHIGTNKTGSSFLQTLSAKSRDILQNTSIYFPRGSRDNDMLEGKISPGNGEFLLHALLDNDFNKTIALLKQYIQEAKNKKCDNILVSNELLIRCFSYKESLILLEKAANEVGLIGLYAICFFREPISHTLSLYKHRAKFGNVLPIDQWLDLQNETFDFYSSFLSNFKSSSIQWTFFSYENKPQRMVEKFFNNWLSVQLGNVVIDQLVNTSLTLSELVTIRNAKEKCPGLEYILYEGFNKIKSDEKYMDDDLTLNYKKIIAHKLLKYKDVIYSLNDLLDDQNKFQLDWMNDEQIIKYDFNAEESSIPYSFSGRQIQMIFTSYNRYHKANVGFNRVVQKAKRIVMLLINNIRLKKKRALRDKLLSLDK